MKFVGRQNEINSIEYLLKDGGFQGVCVYGRRRLGKTELLKHCLLNKGVPAIIYQCNQDSELNNTLALTKSIEDELGLSHLHFDSFIDAIEFIFIESKKKTIYFVIDEYPFIRNLVKGLDSKIQKIIDDYHSSTKLKFFLSGSSISIMEDVISRNNPLYRRFSLSILLKEMDYYDSSLFYPSFSLEDKVRLYSAFGGVPFYNEQINSKLSVKENIILLLSGKFAHLGDDVTINLKSELSKVNNANAVFSSIANGAFHYSDILSKSHVSSSPSLADTLEKLQRMDLIENISPINDKNNKMKSGYQISDNAIRFYYRYIYHNLSSLNIMDSNLFYDTFINDDFESFFVPKTFEIIVKQYLIRQNIERKLDPILLDIGTYWYDNPKERKNGQFDVVGKAKDGYIFYEVKFTNSKITDQIIEEEINEVKNTNLNAIDFGFASKSGFNLNRKYSYKFITLEDIYK